MTEPQILRRLKAIQRRHLPWYDWGHRVMILVGRADGRDDFTNFPRVRDMWFRREDDGTFTTARSYSEISDRNDGEWRIFDSQDDGHTVIVGWYPGPDGDGRLHPSKIDGRDEQRLFLRWFVWEGWVKAEWFGLRRWLYGKALHAVVERKIPFTCQAVPSKFSGGYSHWHCELKRKHAGKHRFRNYVWADGGKAEHDPVARSAS